MASKYKFCLKKYNMKAVKALKSIIILLNVYHNGNIIPVFYIKYNVIVFQKNTAHKIRSKKKILGL